MGVYESPDEFARVQGKLAEESRRQPADTDLLFLLGYQQYFSGDAQAMSSFALLRRISPNDEMLALFESPLTERFSGAEDLPPIR